MPPLENLDSKLNTTIRQQAQRLERLTQLLEMRLPPECNQHFHVASMRDRLVVVLADSPVWAARLRQLGPEILAILQQQASDRLQHIQVKSRPASTAAQTGRGAPRINPKRRISSESLRLIEQAAAGIGDDRLRAALKKLAAHGAARVKAEKK